MLQDFLDHIAVEKRFSEHTVVAYAHDLNSFIEFYGIESKQDWVTVNEKGIRGWIVEMVDAGLSSTTVNRKLSALSSYFKWLMKEGVIERNPMRGVKGPKRAKRLPVFIQQRELTLDKTEELFDDSFDALRDQLMLELFYQTGMRLSELIGLEDSAVHTNQLKVLGKRNKERIIPITQELNERIREYRVKRNETTPNPQAFLVLNNGKKLYPKFVYRRINHYLGLLTNANKRSPHVLRHTFATHMLNNGAGLEVLKTLLGHANLSATQVYTHNSFAELTKIYSQSHPRGTKK